MRVTFKDYGFFIPTSPLPTSITGYWSLKMLPRAKSCQDHKKDRYDPK
jgi:hypothetical protein